MKKILHALIAITLVTSPFLLTKKYLNTTSNQIVILNDNTLASNSDLILNDNNIIWYPPNTIENIIENINNTINDYQVNQNQNISNMEKNVQEQYDKYFNNKKGVLKLIKMIPKNEIIIESFENNYQNDTPNEQTFQTQSYQTTISNSYSFSWKLSEKINLKTSFKIPFIGSTDFSIELSSEQTSTINKKICQTLTNPSQTFVVSPHSRGEVSYIIKQGIYYNEGVIAYEVDLYDRISSLPYWSNKFQEWAQTQMTIKSIIKLLNDSGYGEQIKYDAKQFSVISTDNPNNPTSATLNLPVSWESQGGKLEVTFTQKSL